MIGQTLGHYRIEARLGSGAMGVVYRAGDERLHRTVALKLLGGTGTGSTPQDRSRLLDEARAASHLNHPHICTVYEVGEVDGLAFIAMEYIDGRPLSELVPSHGLPVERRAALRDADRRRTRTRPRARRRPSRPQDGQCRGQRRTRRQGARLRRRTPTGSSRGGRADALGRGRRRSQPAGRDPRLHRAGGAARRCG